MTSEAADVARMLQQGLGPAAVDNVAGMVVEARYRAGGLAEVGGDWYDVLALPEGGAAVVIGDVAGHGIAAAATMGHLRHSARAYLVEERSPAAILDRLNRLTHWLLPGEIATAIVAIFDAGRDDVRVACAGHLPPLAVSAASAAFLAVEGGPALGVSEAATYPETTHVLDDAAMLLFTDGLVERRGESIDAGLARLAEVTARQNHATSFLDELIEEMIPPEVSDDLAVLLVRRSA